MNDSNFVPAPRRQKKRRPAGISRRQKRRALNFETLEDRRVMSATPASAGFEFTDSQIRELLLDSQTLGQFAEAADLSQYSASQLANTREWLVLAAEGVTSDQIAAATGVSVAGELDVLPWTYTVGADGGNYDELVSALSGTELVDYFYPLVPVGVEYLATTNDEFLDNQWSLINFGQDTGNPDFAPIFGVVDEDINIEGAWDLVTGEGVVIGIVDTGVLHTHPDLAANIRADLSVDLADGAGDGNPTGTGVDGHGTSVAGLAAGVGNNGIGIAGVAYNADIAPIRLFSDDVPTLLTDQQIGAAFLYEAQQIDVYNHSWGPAPPADDQGVVTNPRAIIELGPIATVSLRNSVFFGRKVNQTDINGLGSVHVVSAGNSAAGEDSGNYSELVNSRYTIGVTSVIETGEATNYAESSAAVLVAAPSGSNPLEIIRDEQLGSGLYTADLLGDDGFNESAGLFGIETDADFLENTDYSSRFNGTSASAPLVSGVIALMLEANPNLTYRDIQHILVRSSRQNVPDDASWVTNLSKTFNDPLAFDSIPTPEGEGGGDGIFDGAWPLPRPATPEMPGDPPVPEQPHTQVYYYEPTLPDQFANGAGFTVSLLPGRRETGYGHGVVDATLAVEMARNWVTLGGQTSEFTWTTGPLISGQINTSAITDEDSGTIRVPGGVVGDNDPDDPNAFIDFFNEFNVEVTPGVPPEGEDDEGTEPEGPFLGDDPPVNTRDDLFGFGDITVPGIPLAPPSMTVEWIEVELDLSAPNADDYDFLRVILVSPDGTQSDLKNYSIPNVDGGIFHDVVIGPAGDPVGNLTNDSGDLRAVFTTNRHWGERTEPKARLNTDGTTVNAHSGTETSKINAAGDPFNPDGDPITDGWHLIFENYGDSVIDINTYEVAFHGIDTAGTGRIQGAVGVDDNADGVFSDLFGLESNFTRYTEVNLLDGLLGDDGELGTADDLTPEDPAFVFLASSDPHIQRASLGAAQESWAAGVIVYVDLDTNGVRDFTDPSFQVGHDGNYYFDLAALGDGETYDVRIDPDSLAAAGLMNSQNLALVNGAPLAQVTALVSGERVDGFNVDGGSIAAAGIDGAAIQTSVPELNILLTPNAIPENIVNISGVVYADLNLNNVNDADDAPIGNADVFIDLNQNGVFTPGFDPVAKTQSDGSYEFVDLQVEPGFYSVTVLTGSTGTFSLPVNPNDASEAFFFEPELVTTTLDFGFTIGGGSGTGASTSAISGVVFEDVNSNGERGANESGLAGVATAYLDLNDNNVRDADEPSSSAFNNGSFVFNSVAPGEYAVRIEFDEVQYRQTTPARPADINGNFDPDDFELIVNVTAGGAITGLEFGLFNLAIADYGDLPSDFYPTTEAQNGARHLVFPDFFLGAGVDAELDGPVGSDGTGDDTTGIDDEDGVVFSELFANSTTITATVTANTNGGFLQAWFDFNEDHIFQPSELVIPEVLLDQGDTTFEIPVPADLTSGTVFARFRYGEQGIASYDGLALKGEVEDYAIPVQAVDPGVAIVRVGNPDFDGDGDIDGSDFLALQRGFGSSEPTSADGDANDDGQVDALDLTMFVRDYGVASQGGGSPNIPALIATLSSDLEESNGSPVSQYYTISAGGPRAYQPGFPEELPGSSAEAEAVRSQRTRAELAAVAGRVATRSAYALPGTSPESAEQQVLEQGTSYRFDQASLAFDAAFAESATRDSIAPAERNAYAEEVDELEALTLALDEETDWLFG